MSTETEMPAPPSNGWRSPLLLAGIGLVLMVGGYKAMTYVPLTPRQAEQEQTHAQLRDLASKRQAQQAPDDRLADRLKDVAPPWRTPPYQLEGRLALYAGLFLFAAAGVLMYRQRPAPEGEPAEEEHPDDSGALTGEGFRD